MGVQQRRGRSVTSVNLTPGGSQAFTQRRRIASLILSLAVMVGLLVTATPAQATHDSFDRWLHGQACLFQYDSGRGEYLVIGSGNIPIWFNDRASSVWNRTGHWLYLYEHAYYGGLRMDLPPYDGPRNLFMFWNDRVSSTLLR